MSLTFSSQYNFVPRYFRLALANVLSNIMVPLANLVSIIFLGHLSEIQHFAGVALAVNLLNSLYFVLLFLRMGTTGLTAQAVGQDNREGVLLVGLRNGLIALVLGIALVLLQYPIGELGFGLLNVTPEIKASGMAYFNSQIWGAPAVLLNFVLIGWLLGREKNSLVILLSVVGNGLKIALDYLFIIHLGWESTGAGISSATSQYLSFLVGSIYFCTEIQWFEIRAVAGKIWNVSAIQSNLSLNGNILISNLVILLTSLIFNYQGAQMGTMIYAQNSLLMLISSLNVYFVEGLGFGTETLVGNFKGKGALQQLAPVAGVSVLTALLVGLFFGGVCLLFPDTVFGLLTNHTEVISNIDTFIPWLLLLLIFGSIGFTLEGYFLGLAQGHTLRNVSLVALAVAFAPTDFAAIKFSSNHILWLTLCSFYGIRMVMLGVKLPSTFKSNIEDGADSSLALEASRTLSLALDAPSEQIRVKNLQAGQDEKPLTN